MTFRIPAIAALVALATLRAVPASAQVEVPELAFEIETRTLDNGLRVVLAPDDASPTVGIAVFYDVGSRDEVVGRSGFAHLFEHMMFQGSENVGKGEHFQYVNRNGGRMNGTTSEDRTNYFEILPSDRLALGLWLEADRMRSLDISAANFDNQREVVKEERRLRVDNQPYAPAWIAFFELGYDNWAYGHSVIGSMEDLDAAELADVQAFFDLYYAPNNAVLSIAGDFEIDAAMELVETYFGTIPAGEAPPEVEIVEPQQQAMQENEMPDELAAQPALMMGWHVPSIHHSDHEAVRVLSQVLSAGESSRLYSRLVREEQVALEVRTHLDRRRGPDFLFLYTITRGEDPEVARDLILEEAANLVSGGISQEELDTAKEQLFQDTISRLETNLGRALVFGHDALYYGDAARINGELDRIDAMTLADVHAVAARYLVETNLDVLLVRTVDEEESE